MKDPSILIFSVYTEVNLLQNISKGRLKCKWNEKGGSPAEELEGEGVVVEYGVWHHPHGHNSKVSIREQLPWPLLPPKKIWLEY